MRRRGGWIGILAAAMLGLHPVSAAAAPVISAGVGSTPTGQLMAPGFVGVSVEYSALHAYTGRDPRAVNPILIELLRALAPGGAPVIRIGGDSTDSTWWPLRAVIPPVGVKYSLTQGWLRLTRALASALGARLILGVNLAGGRPALAAAEADALLHGIGRRFVEALEIGNEPDLYGVFPWFRDRSGHVFFARGRRYNVRAYAREFARWRAALPAVPLAGPALAQPTWLSGLRKLLRTERRLRIITVHRYPLRAGQDPTSPSYASIANLLSDQASRGLARSVSRYVPVAHASGRQFRIGEMNSASHAGQPGTSDTFAAALWVLDALFNLAAVGVDGVNVHSLPHAAYEPVTFSQVSGTWHAFVHPEYYGMLAFVQAFPPGAQLLAVSAPSGPVKLWATRGADGHIRVTLINKDTTNGYEVQVQVPGADSTVGATVERLQAPSASSTAGVTLGGQTFGNDTTSGTLGPPQTDPASPMLGSYVVDLPAASAALLTQ